MSQERLPVRKIREVLRLKNEGFSNRAIARICKDSNSTVGAYVERARQAGLNWPLPEGMSEEALYQSLFLEEVHRELAKRGVSLRLLWQEYREKNPDGYGKTQQEAGGVTSLNALTRSALTLGCGRQMGHYP